MSESYANSAGCAAVRWRTRIATAISATLLLAVYSAASGILVDRLAYALGWPDWIREAVWFLPLAVYLGLARASFPKLLLVYVPATLCANYFGPNWGLLPIPFFHVQGLAARDLTDFFGDGFRMSYPPGAPSFALVVTPVFVVCRWFSQNRRMRS